MLNVFILVFCLWGAFFAEGAELSEKKQLFILKDERIHLHKGFLEVQKEVESQLQGGDVIGNGGGFVEQEYSFYYLRLGELFSDCLQRQCVNELFRTIVVSLYDVWLKRQAYPTPLRFLTDSSFKTFFNNEESIVTGYYSDSTVYFNEDKLLATTGYGRDVDIIKNWIMILGRQAGIVESAPLRFLSSILFRQSILAAVEPQMSILNNEIRLYHTFFADETSDILNLKLNAHVMPLPVSYACVNGGLPKRLSYKALRLNGVLADNNMYYVSFSSEGTASCFSGPALFLEKFLLKGVLKFSMGENSNLQFVGFIPLIDHALK